MRFLRLPLLGFVPDVGKLVAGNSHGLAYAKNLPPPPVPLASQKKEGNDQLMISQHPLSLMGEMYRSICTAIMFSKAEKPPRTILITSSQPSEGKTVSAINISSMLAQSGGRVLLIDADLHGGRCHKLLGMGNGNGLSNVLAGTEDSARLIKKTKINNLHLLSRGTLPPNPAALLGFRQDAADFGWFGGRLSLYRVRLSPLATGERYRAPFNDGRRCRFDYQGNGGATESGTQGARPA